MQYAFNLFCYKIFVHWKSKLLNVLMDSVLKSFELKCSIIHQVMIRNYIVLSFFLILIVHVALFLK